MNEDEYNEDELRYKDPEKRRAWRKDYGRRWRARNQDKVKAARERYRKSGRKNRMNKLWRMKLRLEVLIHYGGNPPICACCSEDIIEFLSIDHINNDGAKHRKELGIRRESTHGTKFYRWLRNNNFPEGFQVLCYNCNCGRAKMEDKICPHKRAKAL